MEILRYLRIDFKSWNMKVDHKEHLEWCTDCCNNNQTRLELKDLGINQNTFDEVINQSFYIAHEGVDFFIALAKLSLASHFPNLDEVHQKIKKGSNLIFIIGSFSDLQFFVQDGLLLDVVTSKQSSSDIVQADWSYLRVLRSHEETGVAYSYQISVRSLSKLPNISFTQIEQVYLDEVIICTNVIDWSESLIRWLGFNLIIICSGLIIIPIKKWDGLKNNRLVAHLHLWLRGHPEKLINEVCSGLPGTKLDFELISMIHQVLIVIKHFPWK
jgi:hypothetical protein